MSSKRKILLLALYWSWEHKDPELAFAVGRRALELDETLISLMAYSLGLSYGKPEFDEWGHLVRRWIGARELQEAEKVERSAVFGSSFEGYPRNEEAPGNES